MTLNVIGDGTVECAPHAGFKKPGFLKSQPGCFLGFIGLWVLSVFLFQCAVEKNG